MPKITFTDHNKNDTPDDTEYIKMSGEEEEYEQSDINCDKKICCYVNIRMLILLLLSVVFMIIIAINHQ